jgi:hypothetical protein
MAFELAYSLGGNVISTVKDLPLDTAANYGTVAPTKGDLVVQASGLLRRAAVDSTAASVMGILVGKEFTGLVAAGQPYAATKSSFTDEATNATLNPNGVGKVAMSKSLVYRVPVWQGGATDAATNAHIGSTFAIAVDETTEDQTVDLNNTSGSTKLVQLVAKSPDGKTVFVTLL